jgi:hypothetical protein
MKCETYLINDNEYINAIYILKNAPIYSKGVRSTRELMKKKKLNKDTDYIFVRLKDNKYIISNGKSIRLDKIFIKKTILNSIPELNNEKGITDDGIEEAPDIIELKDSEKFFDNKGKPLEIETRGERNEDKIYFKVKDVEKVFGIKRLDKKLITENTNYKLNIDYKYFICKNVHNVDKQTNKNIFLSYEGILRVLFVSRNNKTKSFRKWATKTLFTVQMGTKEQKQILCDKILGNDIETSRKVIKLNNSSLSAIYLLTLGYVKDLKKEMFLEDYKDDMIVCKYGRSDDLSRRLLEHKKTFKSIKTATPMLKIYSYIDSNYASKAEKQIKNYFKGANKSIKYKDFDELVVLDKDFMKNTEEQYSLISSNYVGTQHELILKIKELEYELLEKQNELNESIKDNEILKLKLEILEMKISK